MSTSSWWGRARYLPLILFIALCAVLAHAAHAQASGGGGGGGFWTSGSAPGGGNGSLADGEAALEAWQSNHTLANCPTCHDDMGFTSISGGSCPTGFSAQSAQETGYVQIPSGQPDESGYSWNQTITACSCNSPNIYNGNFSSPQCVPNTCASGQTMVNGQCQCPAGMSVVNGVCTTTCNYAPGASDIMVSQAGDFNGQQSCMNGCAVTYEGGTTINTNPATSGSNPGYSAGQWTVNGKGAVGDGCPAGATTDTHAPATTNSGNQVCDGQVCVDMPHNAICDAAGNCVTQQQMTNNGGCSTTPAGNVFCVASAPTPPTPDNGTPGTPATPDQTVSQTGTQCANDGTCTTDYYSQSTASKSTGLSPGSSSGASGASSGASGGTIGGSGGSSGAGSSGSSGGGCSSSGGGSGSSGGCTCVQGASSGSGSSGGCGGGCDASSSGGMPCGQFVAPSGGGDWGDQTAEYQQAITDMGSTMAGIQADAKTALGPQISTGGSLPDLSFDIPMFGTSAHVNLNLQQQKKAFDMVGAIVLLMASIGSALIVLRGGR